MQRAFLGALTMVTLGLLVAYLIETSGGNQLSLDAEEMKRLKDSIGSVSNQQLEDMINMACESVQPDTESEEFCDEFFFFTGDLDEEERKRRKRLGLYVRRN